MKIKNVFLSALLAVTLLGVRPVSAQYYNGSEEEYKQIVLDKEVRALDMGEWYDNLDATQVTFGKESLVDFQITVKNTGNKELRNIEVKDVLPSYMEYVYGPDEYDASSRTATWKIEQINAGENKVFHLRARVQKDNLANGVIQLCNWSKAESEDNYADEDSACFYIYGQGATVIPETGTPELLIGSIILASLGTAAWVLRKIGRGGF
jgi:uncharacterized repeat protein (TIGR01451 family)